MKNKRYIIILSTILLIILILFTNNVHINADNMNWNKFKNENSNKLKTENNKNKILILKYNLAIANANLGKIKKSENYLNEIDKTTNQDYFLELLTPFIKNSNQINNEILHLNYNAFYYLIEENYSFSADYFLKILKKSPENIWAMNYLAANYIMMENERKAEKWLKKAEKIKENKFTNLLYGYIYYQQGNYIKALSRFSKSGNLINKNIFK